MRRRADQRAAISPVTLADSRLAPVPPEFLGAGAAVAAASPSRHPTMSNAPGRSNADVREAAQHRTARVIAPGAGIEGFVGRMSDRRGADLLVDAAARLRRRRASGRMPRVDRARACPGRSPRRRRRRYPCRVRCGIWSYSARVSTHRLDVEFVAQEACERLVLAYRPCPLAVENVEPHHVDLHGFTERVLSQRSRRPICSASS